MVVHLKAERTSSASFPDGATIYYWPRGFLLLSPSFIVNRGERPTRRPSIRVMLSLQEPFELEFSNGSWIRTRAVMMSAEVRRRQVIARNCGFILLDMAASTPEYAALAPLVAGQSVLPLEASQFEPLLPRFADLHSGLAAGNNIPDLRRDLVHTIAGVLPQAPSYDHRVEASLRIIQERCLDEVSLESIAEAVHLSPDRLRHLFKEQVGYTVSHFARTAAVWKALAAWSQSQEQQWTKLAHEAGFHDYSHFSHAFKEMFGFNPGFAKGARQLKVIGCQ